MLRSKYGDPVHLLRLELHNNTRWRITWVGSPDQLGGSGWFYLVTTDDSCHTPIYPPMGNWGDVGGVVGVGPGQSVPLTVAARDLTRGLGVEIDFNFEWDHR